MLNHTFTTKHFELLEQYLKGRSDLCQSEMPTCDTGMNREFFLRDILKRHLPRSCEITSGSLCDSQSKKPTGQIDLVLFNPLSMVLNIGATNCCPVEGVYAVIEVKSSVNEEHFESAVQKFIQVQALKRTGLYTNILGYTDASETYHFNTVGTVLFAYSNYTYKTAVNKARQLARSDWNLRPEMIYSLDRSYLLVRDDHCRWQSDDTKDARQPSWIQRLSDTSLDGYFLIKHNSFLCLCVALTKRIQSNYHLLPTLVNYVDIEQKL